MRNNEAASQSQIRRLRTEHWGIGAWAKGDGERERAGDGKWGTASIQMPPKGRAVSKLKMRVQRKYRENLLPLSFLALEGNASPHHRLRPRSGLRPALFSPL